LALEYKLDIKALKGTGNFNRVTADDVLIAAGKKVVVTPATPVAQALAPAAADAPKPASPATVPGKGKESATPPSVSDGVVVMDGMQKAVAKNMEKTLSVPVFRVSR